MDDKPARRKNPSQRRIMRQHVELPAARDLLHAVAHAWITGGYFEAIGIPLKR